MYARIETITPEIATAYLKKNVKNRHVRKNTITKYARDMKNGKWQLNPQGISFYEDGSLADGQHRLMAVVSAGVPVDFLVVYDVPNESTILDYGMKRRIPDILTFAGLEATNESVALVNLLFRIAGCSSITIPFIHSFIDKNEEFISSAIYLVQHGCESKNALSRNAAMAAAAFCALYSGVEADVIDEFFRCVNSGRYREDKNQGAAIVLRNLLLEGNATKTTSGREEAFFQACFALKDFSTATPRKLKYKTYRNIPFWDYTKRELLNKYIAAYKGKEEMSANT